MNLRNKENMNMRKMNVKIITHLIYVAPINAKHLRGVSMSTIMKVSLCF